MITTNRTLAYWKECAVTLRQRIAEGHASRDHFRELVSALRLAKHRIGQIERRVLVCIGLAAILFLAGCNTVAGLGRDVGWTANKVADMAEQGKLDENK